MKKVTLEADLTEAEIVAVVNKMMDIINSNEKPIVKVPDLVTILSLLTTSVVGSVAEDSESKARTIWLNIAMRVNDWLKTNIGAPLEIKVMDDKPLKN